MMREERIGWDERGWRWPLAAGISFACLCFLAMLGKVDSPRHTLIFHWAGTTHVLFWTLGIDTLVLAAGVTVGVRALARWPRMQRAVSAALLCVMPWVLAKEIAVLLDDILPRAASLGIFAGCMAAWVWLGVTMRPSRWKRIRRGARVALTGMAAAGVLLVVEAVWFGWEARHLNKAPGITPPAMLTESVLARRGRVVWLLLDELGYAQVYGGRMNGLTLPGFDRLRGEATVFSNVRPIGTFTEVVMPQLLTGRRATSVSSDGRGDLTMRDHGKGWVFDQHETVFADAEGMGYATGVVGWYMPYCRMMPDVLQLCAWTGLQRTGGMMPGRTLEADLLEPFREAAEAVFRPVQDLRQSEREDGVEHIAAFETLLADGDRALNDGRIGFLLVHMPVPHPVGIWDRRRGRFAIGRSAYVDNLALADAYVAHVRAVLEARGEWKDATVVVMGDHAWRTKLIWEETYAWGAEDQAASHGGQWDDRPAMVVKLPGQTSGAEINAAFDEGRMRAMLDALLARRVGDVASLRAWVAGG